MPPKPLSSGWARLPGLPSSVEHLANLVTVLIFNKFTQAGQGDTAQSWNNKGPNKEISPPEVKKAIGADVLAALEQQTGLSQDEILARLSRELPNAVDKYTPDGRIPNAALSKRPT